MLFDNLKSPFGLVEIILFLVPGTILSLCLFMLIDLLFFKAQVLTKVIFINTPQLSLYLLFLSGLSLGVLLHILVLWHPLCYKHDKISKIFHNKLFENYKLVKEQPKVKEAGKHFYRVFFAEMSYSLLFAALVSLIYLIHFYHNMGSVIISIPIGFIALVYLIAANRIFLEVEIEERSRSSPQKEKRINEIKK
jgi:hypothetical protein